MPTLQDVTLAHSRRLSEIHKAREAQAAEAVLQRDVELRALPSTSKAYAQFDEDMASAREKRAATEQKAAAARVAALDGAIEARGEGLEGADATRRAADLAAIEARQKAEAVAERKYRDAISALSATTALTERVKVTRDAERVRRAELEAAQRAYAEAVAAAQSGYQGAVVGAVANDRRAAREADRAYADAVRLADVALRAAVATAERVLNSSLSALDDARKVVDECRQELAAVTESTRRLESDEFDRFRRELDAVRSG